MTGLESNLLSKAASSPQAERKVRKRRGALKNNTCASSEVDIHMKGFRTMNQRKHTYTTFFTVPPHPPFPVMDATKTGRNPGEERGKFSLFIMKDEFEIKLQR